MAERLSDGADEYALYLPAIQTLSAGKLANPRARLGHATNKNRLTARALNWLEPDNRHWSYNWCLASAGHFFNQKTDNVITNRHPATVIVGDSGGYQAGTGALAETKSWLNERKDPKKIIDLWRRSAIKRDIIKWLDQHCNYAMTLDMPLWVGMKEHESKSPFHHCSEQQLIDISVENLDHLIENRDRITGAKYLNVLQGFSPTPDDLAGSIASEERWFNAVKDYELEGWSLGGQVGWRGGIYRVLRRILLLRDAGLLDSPREWLHVLGVSQMTWAVYLSAIQRGIRSQVNSHFTVSYDSATPYLLGGRFQKYAVNPNVSDRIEDWVIRYEDLPTGYATANAPVAELFPESSPITGKMTLRDLNPRIDDFDGKTTDELSDELIFNHNVYVTLLAFRKANDAVFKRRGRAPEALINAAQFIERLFSMRDWTCELDARKESLQALLDREAVVEGVEDRGR